MSRATREAYGQTLVELVNEGHDIVAVEADLAGSTKLADLQKLSHSAWLTWVLPSRTW